MSIYNLNPRRVVWFSPNEPSNKYDIWLSKNAHLDENGEPTTDSNSQRDCDYIFKIYDCGKWNPIVGFNTTAANKIDIVEGNTLYHPAIFTGENPNDLYDAGTLGELLANTNFVTEYDWQNLFDTTQFQNAFNSQIIGGNDYNWSTLINSNIDFATTTQCGGILSDTHTYDALSAFKPIEVKFYPTTSAYSSKLHRLCVSASDVIEQINGYYNDNPGGSSININWNSTTIHQLAEVLQDIFKNSSSLGFEDVWSLASDPHVYPHIWGVSSTNVGKFLRINPTWNPEGTGWSQSNNNMDWVDLGEIIPDLVNNEDIFVPKDGINISYVAPHGDDRQYVEWGLNHIEEATDGQFCRKTTNNGEADIEWTDSPYGELTYSSTSQNLYVVRGCDDSQKSLCLLNGSGGWTKTGDGNLVYSHSSNDYRIKSNINVQNATEITSFASTPVINISTAKSSNNVSEYASITYNNSQVSVNEYQYKKLIITEACTINFNNISDNEFGNPIYIKVDAQDDISLYFVNTRYIYNGGSTLNKFDTDTKWLITIQFGVVKFEQIVG